MTESESAALQRENRSPLDELNQKIEQIAQRLETQAKPLRGYHESAGADGNIIIINRRAVVRNPDRSEDIYERQIYLLKPDKAESQEGLAEKIGQGWQICQWPAGTSSFHFEAIRSKHFDYTSEGVQVNDRENRRQVPVSIQSQDILCILLQRLVSSE